MIEHMFEQAGTSCPAPTSGNVPVSPVLPAVPGTGTGDDAAHLAVVWREAAPGPEMIAALASVSLQTCTDEQLLDVLAGWQQVEAWVSAQQTLALAAPRPGCWKPPPGSSPTWTGTPRGRRSTGRSKPRFPPRCA